VAPQALDEALRITLELGGDDALMRDASEIPRQPDHLQVFHSCRLAFFPVYLLVIKRKRYILKGCFERLGCFNGSDKTMERSKHR